MNDDDQENLLEYMTWEEAQVAQRDARLLVIPTGAVEQHGPHLPLGTDAIVAFELARRVARRHGSLVAPAMYYMARSSPRSGGGGRSFPGSTGVTGQTLMALVHDVTSEFLRSGFRRIAYLNGHYENSQLVYEALTEAIEPYQKTCKVIMVNWWEQIRPEDIGRIFGENFPGWEAEHAGVAETSLMEELRPQLVRTALKGEGGTPRLVAYDIFPPPSDVIPPNGVPWRSDPASPQIGHYLADVLVDRIAGIFDREFPPLASAASAASPAEGALHGG